MAKDGAALEMTVPEPGTRIGPQHRFAGFDDRRVLHGVSGRRGGCSAPPFASLNLSVRVGDDRASVASNRRRFETIMGFESRQTAFGKLTHGNAVTTFQVGNLLPSMDPPDLGWPMFNSDAAISNVPGLVLVMTFADCVPILLWDPAHDACALVHAGWRGTVLRVASTAVRAMQTAFGSDPAAVQAGIGPSIGPECYPVGADVRDQFDAAYGSDAPAFFSGDLLDLWGANRSDLISVGIKPENVDVAEICTACNTDQFFSHRGEHGSTGRFGACIGIRYPGRFGTPG